MSERLINDRPEHGHETVEAGHEAAHERERSTAETAPEQSAARSHAEELGRKAAAEKRVEAARPAEADQLKAGLDATPNEPQIQAALTTEQRQQTLRTFLGQIRHHMSGTDQAFSKFIHKPSVNTISEAGGKTLFRPSGIMAGGLFALVGSGYYFYAVKQTGFGYNFTLAVLLFVGGFAVGLLVESILKLVSKRS